MSKFSYKFLKFYGISELIECTYYHSDFIFVLHNCLLHILNSNNKILVALSSLTSNYPLSPKVLTRIVYVSRNIKIIALKQKLVLQQWSAMLVVVVVTLLVLPFTI